MSKHGQEGGQGETQYKSKLPFTVLVCTLEMLECQAAPISNQILKSAYSSFLHSEPSVCMCVGEDGGGQHKGQGYLECNISYSVYFDL